MLASPHFRFVADVENIYYYSSTGEAVKGIYGQALYFGLILLIALLIATPEIKAFKRIENLATGLWVVFAVHSATLFILSRLVQSRGCVSMTAPVVLISAVGLNLFPVLVWASLCLRQLFAMELQDRNMTPETLKSAVMYSLNEVTESLIHN